MSSETFPFRAEVQQLLDLMIHSLYSHKEIFLRELISNASDALDRLRFEALTRPELLSGGGKLEIRLEVDPASRTLTVHDTGIGMSRQELIDNIGTIAKSGTRELAERLRKSKVKSDGGTGEGPTELSDLIGQFGVGFYSSFMVADRVVVVTRKAGEPEGTRWESTGTGEFTVAPGERASQGTSVTLHLKPVDEEQGIEDFTDDHAIERIVRRYSDFIAYPIVLGEKTLNSMKPIWERPASDVKPEEYAEFYKHISHDWREPLLTISQRAEGLLEYRALLFVPSEAPFDLFYMGYESGLKLYVRRVLIVDKSPDLLPRYLRFLTGVVDSADLPLNVSREMLQHDRQIRQIRKGLVKKVLDTLADAKEKEPEKYLSLFKAFGRVLKEGPSEDYENKEKLADLLLFQSSPARGEARQSLRVRLPDESRAGGDLLPDRRIPRVDRELAPSGGVSRQRDRSALFDGCRRRARGGVDRGVPGKEAEVGGQGYGGSGNRGREGREEEGARREVPEITRASSSVSRRPSTTGSKKSGSPRGLPLRRPVSSGAEHDFSPRLEQLLKRDTDRPRQRRILELNPDHEIVMKLEKMAESSAAEQKLDEYAELLYGYAVLAEGSELPDPAGFARRIAELMTRGLS